MKKCLDSTFLSDLIRGREGAPEQVEQWVRAGHKLVMTAVSWYEVGLGISLERGPEKRRELMERWTQLTLSIDCLLFTRISADIASNRQAELYRRGSPAPVMDLLIAAIACANDCDAIVTRHAIDFSRIGLVPTFDE
jgi:predicted nucleic acid-binding protein